MKESIYAKFKPATCLPDCWCEMPRVGEYILEPGNTWSNLAFIFCGVFITFFLKNIPNKKLISFSFIFLGLGSFAFHATQTFIGQTLDVFAMYFIVAVFAFSLWKEKFDIPKFILFNISSLLLLWFIPGFRRWGFLLLVLFLIVMSIKKLKWNKYVGLSIASMVVGQILWNLDRLKIICDPKFMYNGHFFWHIFSALSALLFVFNLQKNNQLRNN